MSVRVRFAPSPTGLLHVGNIRIAIINYIYALKNDGQFLLRIDDTDKIRSTKEYENAVYEDLNWLGLPNKCDARQSNNIADYDAAFEYLKENGYVYPCFETAEELELARKIQLMNKMPPVYNRAALKLSKEEIDQRIKNGQKPYWRFMLKDNASEWDDLVTGFNSIGLKNISDPVIIKPDGTYVYTFASVVDDINMKISHIIRGADHVTNTAAQIAIFKALNADVPHFAHLPLLSAADGGDISKRAGSNYSIRTLRENGVEPLAIVAALTSLGSSYNYKPGDKLSDIVNEIDFRKLSISASKFSLDSIYHISEKVVSSYDFADVKERLQSELPDNGNLEKFWTCVRGNLKKFDDVKEWYDICFNDVVSYKTSKPDLAQAMLDKMSDDCEWSDWLSAIKEIVPYRGADLMHEIRLIFTNKDRGPDLRSLYECIDHDLLRKRIKN